MKEESRKPLENVSANIVAASALNRFENMAIGGKAGLSVRKQGSSKSSSSRWSLPGEQSALSSTSPSDCSSTFALSTDVSTVSVRPPDNASRNNSPLCRAGTPGVPRYTQFPPESKLRPNGPSPGCLKVYPPCIMFPLLVDPRVLLRSAAQSRVNSFLCHMWHSLKF
jgi:hypothetical protein